MSIVSRYIIKEFLKYYIMVQIVVLTLFVFIDYLTKIGKFIKAELALSYAFGFVLLKVPFISTLLMPICCILGAVIVFSLMNRNNELLAIKSGGISAFTLMKPVIVSGIISTLLFFVISELIVPSTQTTANGIKRVIRNRDVKTTRDNNIWLKKDNAIVHINYYNAQKKILSGISFFYFDENFILKKRIDAKKGAYDAASWLLENVHEMQKTETETFFSKFHPEMLIEIDIKPEDLKSVIKRSQEMSLKELYLYVTKIRAQGYEPITYVVDMQAKLAFPFSCFIMCVLGAGIALAGKRTQGLATGIAIGICVAFFYWFFHSFCVSLGYGEILPPVVAAWLGNIVFFCISGVVLLNAE